MESSGNNFIFQKDDKKILKRRKWRSFLDKFAKQFIAVMGGSIILAILLIFFYLFGVVLPLFQGAKSNKEANYATISPKAGDTLYLDVEEQSEQAIRYTSNGYIIVFKTKSGSGVLEKKLPVPNGVAITSIGTSKHARGLVALGLSDGTALVVKHSFEVSYEARGDENKRVITPKIEMPFGDETIIVDENGKPIKALSVQAFESETILAGANEEGKIFLISLTRDESFLGGEGELKTDRYIVSGFKGKIAYLFIDDAIEHIFAINQDSEVFFYDIKNKEKPVLLGTNFLFSDGKLTSANLLLGGVSLIVGNDKGRISQWFYVKDENNKKELKLIRDFKQFTNSPIVKIASEKQRKGFIATDKEGNIGIYFSTSNRLLLNEKISESEVKHIAFAPHGDNIVAEDSKGQFHYYSIDNKYPEISWSSLWGKVWYEGYKKPEYLWQSSAATSDVEYKFSLIPLTFGTLKAAFYTMMFAIPLAIMGAIATGYFMRPELRQFVKPTIEIMEAMPTVILGFLAGLWLAPLFEKNIPGIFLIVILFFPTTMFVSYLWHFLPETFRRKLPEGTEPLLIIPPILLLIYVCMSISPQLDVMFFDGDTRIWMTKNLGIVFDQRNTVVVGIAMGIAVIPIIFSIAEDAVFAVPKHLSDGSLALGATPWQTLLRIVLPAASPGIFSALMIGLGRAVGETMIVLMATGNTPVMELNIFQGLRALSANIAVEMPEAVLGSTHYRILFLSALVLLTFTFILNTVAEYVRQNLRAKYGKL